MSWAGYFAGDIHIDHYPRPVCSFDLTLEEEQKKCFHYTSTRPLRTTANLKKSGEDKKLSVRTKKIKKK